MDISQTTQLDEPTAWLRLQEVAGEQDGYFTTWQAENVGFAKSRLPKLHREGAVVRPLRGVYRIVIGPPVHPRVESWLYERFLALDGHRLPWDRSTAPVVVFSHSSAAWLLNLGTLPSDVAEFTSARRRESQISQTKIRTAAIDDVDWRWIADGRVPATTAARTVVDLALVGVGRDYVVRAMRDAVSRGLTSGEQLADTLERRRGSARAAAVGWLSKAIFEHA